MKTKSKKQPTPDIEIHPFEHFVHGKATHLVLGTFPTLKKNWRFNFYYPGRNNLFWRLISDIYKNPWKHSEGEEAAKERHALILKKGIAISDTIYSVQRKVATSSKDSDLVVIEKMDVLKLLRENPSIHTVILAGTSGKISAHALFFEHLKENKIDYEITDGKPPIIGSFMLDGRRINTYSLYSTSGLNIGRYAEMVKQYREYLLQ